MTTRASVPEPLAAFDDRPGTAAAAVDAAGRLEGGLAGDLARAGAFSLFLPAELDGAEAPVPDAPEVIEWVAERSGSVGWCVMIGATTGVLAGWLPRDGAEEIHGSHPEVVTGCACAPTGRAVASGDGYRVRGHWQWGSGSQHCGWLLGGAVVNGDGGAPHLDAAGSPRARLCFAPAEQVGIVPNWEVLGMRGTGALYRFPPFGLLALGIAAVSLGVGRAAVDAAEEAAEVCSRVQRLAGGSGVREGPTVERRFRDAHTATAHVLVSARIHEAVGAVLLGGEPAFAEL